MNSASIGRVGPILGVALTLAAAAAPAGAARFTYHGELMDGGAPAAGRYDLRLRALAGPDAGTALAEPTELPGVAVIDGRLSVELDLPEDADGSTWVEIAVRASGSGEPFTALGEPQPLTKANSTCPGAWALDGNTGVPAGSFLGLADANSSTALVLRARDHAVATFTPRGTAGDHGDAPSVALGAPANLAAAPGATVGGGGATRFEASPCPTCINTATKPFATVAGGRSNEANGEFAALGGGDQNRVLADLATLGGGAFNVASEDFAVVAGGLLNTANGLGAVVAGGSLNCAGGNASWAGGSGAVVRPRASAPFANAACAPASPSGDGNGDEGSFVWADAGGGAFITSGPNQFLVRARGGVGINAAPPVGSVELTLQSDADDGDFANLWLKQRVNANGILLSVGDGAGANDAGFYIDHYTGSAQTRRLELAGSGAVTIRSNITQANTGVTMAANAGAWSSLSDRRLKTAIEAVDAGAILDRLLATPIATWSYAAQGTAVRHIGPMAQDFAAAFGVGENDTTISTVDADGVALAAIQGLHARLAAQQARADARIAALEAQNAQLVAAVSALREQLEGRGGR